MNTFLFPNYKGLIFLRNVGVETTALIKILLLEKIDLFFKLVVLLNQKLVHLHQLFVVVVNRLRRLLLPCVYPLAQFHQNLGIVLNQLSLFGLKDSHQLPHFINNSVFLLQEPSQLITLFLKMLLQLLQSMGIHTSLLLEPRLNSLIDLGRKLFQLLPVLLDFLLHGLLLSKRFLLIPDKLLEQGDTVFALLLHLKCI